MNDEHIVLSCVGLYNYRQVVFPMFDAVTLIGLMLFQNQQKKRPLRSPR